ncbi:MAG: hypothetical protein MJY58_05800 [Bacteroidaceae bacterium]|nr:hypothetical protein [Bacteroidaceae bacterium]
MNNKIQELTDIIYNEGVSKGQAEADRIIEQAQAKADSILADAGKEAARIVADAEKQSKANAENISKELKLQSQQALSALKSEIATVITDRIVKESVSGFCANQEAFNSFVLEVARQWNGAQAPVIASAQAESIKAYFMAKAKELLDAGLEIRQIGNRQTFFSIQPKDGSYKLDFGQQELESWLKSMLRDQLVDVLF